MSIQDERELAERLGGMLDGIEPRPAPLAATIRQGRGIRRRRRITAAAGIAVIVAGAAIIPAVLHSIGAPPPPATHRHRHYTVTVNHLPPQARHGVIASGTQDGHRWQVVMTGTAGKSTFIGSDAPFAGGPEPVPASSEPQFTAVAGGAPTVEVGSVSPHVTRVRLVLSGGKILDLSPVRWSGHPWVAVELPALAMIERAAVYSGSRELGYSIPVPGGSNLVNWWPPGQPGPARYTKVIASGVAGGQAWSIRAEFGPWGYCYEGTGVGDCLDGLQPVQWHSGATITPFVCGSSLPTAGTMGGLAVAAPAVREVRLQLSHGGTEVYRTVDVEGTQTFVYLIPKGQHITGASGYDARGRLIGTVGARTMSC